MSVSTRPDGQGAGAPATPAAGDPLVIPTPETPPVAPSNPEANKTFSQTDVDRIVRERLDREKGKYSDYDEAKAKAARLDALEESQKSELDKEKDRADKAEAKAAEKIRVANMRLVASAIMTAVAGKIHEQAVGLVVKALADSDKIKVEDDGTVTGADKVVEDFLKENEYLLAKNAPGTSGAEFGGQPQKSIDEQIAEAESKGDWRTANALQLQKLRAARQS